uniref:ymf67 n=1 Tax=Cryptocaryon irritans TaxID=153251 RepID=UPI0022FD6CA8|nr:ymf67 [Cryptocaryon irritans]WBP62331.1 ymf67 [Cryptocaryon irritans]
MMFSIFPLIIFIINIIIYKNSLKSFVKILFKNILNKHFYGLFLKKTEKSKFKGYFFNINLNFLKKKKDLSYLRTFIKTLNHYKAHSDSLKNIFNIDSFLISFFFLNNVIFKKYRKVNFLKKDNIQYCVNDYYEFLIFFIPYSNYLNIYLDKNLNSFYILKNTIKKNKIYLNAVEKLKNFYEYKYLTKNNLLESYKTNILIFNDKKDFFYKNMFTNNYYNYWNKKNSDFSNFEHLNIKVYNTYINKFFSMESLNKFNIFFLRKNRIFNKGRYSRNRQNYRTGFYWCLYVNIIAVFGIYFFFYRFTFNFGYIWWLIYLFFFIFFFNKFFKYKLFNPYNYFNNVYNIFYFYFNIFNNVSNSFFKFIILFLNKIAKFYNNLLILIRFYI